MDESNYFSPDNITLVSAMGVAVYYFYKSNAELKEDLKKLRQEVVELREQVGYYRGKDNLAESIHKDLEEIKGLLTKNP